MKKLRKKLILIAFISSLTVFSVMALGLYATLSRYNARRADALTDYISHNEEVPENDSISVYAYDEEKGIDINLDGEFAFRNRYFVVCLDDEGNVTDIRRDHISSIDEERAGSFASFVLALERKTGYYLHYRYRVIRDDADPGVMIIFLDCMDTIMVQKAFLARIIAVSLFFALAITVVFGCISGRILEPFDKNQRMQKQFITDASHELKTPLAVISANAEVLRYKNGSNEWTDNIVEQTRKMSDLINQLLVLSRMEEVGEKGSRESVDLSETVTSQAKKLGGIFEKKHVAFETDIASGIVISAYRDQIENLCGILIENASKYVTENGRAGVTLAPSGAKRVLLSVYNTSDNVADMDCDRIFERFYRPDGSRSSATGGHGIGLSIAKRIAEKNRGTIGAAVQGDTVTFSVSFPVLA